MKNLSKLVLVLLISLSFQSTYSQDDSQYDSSKIVNKITFFLRDEVSKEKYELVLARIENSFDYRATYYFEGKKLKIYSIYQYPAGNSDASRMMFKTIEGGIEGVAFLSDGMFYLLYPDVEKNGTSSSIYTFIVDGLTVDVEE